MPPDSDRTLVGQRAGEPLTAKERLYRWLNNATFTEENGCRHSQELIAQAIGCDKRTVIRCVQQLEAEGRLRVERPRKRGMCNTYYVSCWNPMRRSGVLNVLRCIREDRARRAQCHPKRTAKAFESSNHLFPSSLRGVSQRGWSCAERTGNERTRFVTDLPIQNALGCARCAELEGQMHKLIVENTDLGTEIAGLQNTNRRLGADLVKAEKKLKSPEASPLNSDVKTILEYWVKQTGHKRASIDHASDRAALVRKQLKRYGAQALMEAIDGAALLPYERFGRRYISGEKDQLATQLEHCIGYDKRIDENRNALRRAVRDVSLNKEWLWDAYQRAQAWQLALSQLVLDAACLLEAGVQLGEPLERFLWRRWNEREREWAEIMAEALNKPEQREVAA